MKDKKSINKNILVIGDIMLDKYIYCDVNRISPEAPIPVLKYKQTKCIPGGAANVANNLVANNCKVNIMSIVGDDENGTYLLKLLDDRGINTEFVSRDNSRVTTTKSRYVSTGQQIFRFDEEDNFSIDYKLENKCLELVESNVRKFDVIVISDYLKGFLTELLTQGVIEIAKRNKIPVIVDPKASDENKYKGCTLIKPNKKEMENFLNGKKIDQEELPTEVKNLKKRIDCKYILATLGAGGMFFIDDEDREYQILSEAKEVFDVTGAGDTVLSFVAMGFDGINLAFSHVELANKAAGIKVGKFGTSVVKYQEIEEKYQINKKVIGDKEIKNIIQNHKKNGERIVFTNGCFDILHAGHVRYLREARLQGDILVVGLNSDRSVKRIKGDNRPIQNQEERSEILQGLSFVDYVVLFEDDTPIELIKQVMPDILVKGGDYIVEEIVGYKEVTKNGGAVITIPFIKGKSTTNIVERIKTLD
ncbi:MAG: D-glycero-beta-D-manno-heptose 1-phosphate adenylyltransferase [Aminipila sp.]